MHIAEMLFQGEDLFAHGMEAKMTRLDNPGMDRPHRNLIHPLTFKPKKRVQVIRRRRLRRGSRQGKGSAQGELIFTPGLMAHPATLIGMINKGYAEHIAEVPFRPISRREKGCLRRETPVFLGNPGMQEQMAVLAGKGGIDMDLRRSMFTPDTGPAQMIVDRNRCCPAPKITGNGYDPGRTRRRRFFLLCYPCLLQKENKGSDIRGCKLPQMRLSDPRTPSPTSMIVA